MPFAYGFSSIIGLGCGVLVIVDANLLETLGNMSNSGLMRQVKRDLLAKSA